MQLRLAYGSVKYSEIDSRFLVQKVTHETYPIKEKSNHESRLAYSRFIVGPLSFRYNQHQFSRRKKLGAILWTCCPVERPRD
jgi:hypothetical protein